MCKAELAGQGHPCTWAQGKNSASKSEHLYRPRPHCVRGRVQRAAEVTKENRDGPLFPSGWPSPDLDLKERLEGWQDVVGAVFRAQPQTQPHSDREEG